MGKRWTKRSKLITCFQTYQASWYQFSGRCCFYFFLCIPLWFPTHSNFIPMQWVKHMELLKQTSRDAEKTNIATMLLCRTAVLSSPTLYSDVNKFCNKNNISRHQQHWELFWEKRSLEIRSKCLTRKLEKHTHSQTRQCVWFRVCCCCWFDMVENNVVVAIFVHGRERVTNGWVWAIIQGNGMYNLW